MYLRNERIFTALTIMLDVAFYAGRTGVVSGACIASRNHMVRRGIEPILQALTRHGLLESVRGPGGGYRVGRPPRLITLRDIAVALGVEEKHYGVGVPFSPLMKMVLYPFWAGLNGAIALRLGEVTVADLIAQAEYEGMKRPKAGPLSFSI